MAIMQTSTQTGMSWVRETIGLFKVAPRRWMLLALTYVGIFMMLPSIPGLQVFVFATILLWPVFIAVAMRMYQNAEKQRQELPSAMMEKIQPKLMPLMMLGGACLLYGVVVNLILSADIHAISQIALAGESSESQAAALLQKMLPLLLKLSLFLLPLMMATWFAPMLIAFNEYSLLKAVKSSIAGSLQYMFALSIAWLVLTAGIIAGMLVLGIVAGIVGVLLPSLAQLFMSFLMFGCLILASALMLAFQYVSYRDVFRAVTSA